MTSAQVVDNLILVGVNPTGREEIGRGAYGRVFEVDYEGTLCAAKEIHTLLVQDALDDELEKIKDDFLRECQIWSTLRHPSIVQFLGLIRFNTELKAQVNLITSFSPSGHKIWYFAELERSKKGEAR